MDQTQILEPLSPDDPSFDAAKTRLKSIKGALNNLNMGKDISFKDFLEDLHLSNEQYLQALQTDIKNTTIYLKRSPAEIRTNQYNTDLLTMWGANIDLQIVTNTFACATYISSYITKSQRGMSQILRVAAEEANLGNDSIREQLRSIGNRFLNACEISAQEAVYHVLGLAMKKSSRKIIFVNTGRPEDRVYLLKPQHVLQSMRHDSEDVQSKSLIQHYQERPADLENICLAEFACYYTKSRQSRKQRSRKAIRNQPDGFPTEQQLEDDDEDQMPETEPQEIPTATPTYTRRKVSYEI